MDGKLEERINNLELELQMVNEKLDKILNILETDCKKMSNHIDFIEEVYDKVKSPFNFVMSSITNLIPDKNRIENKGDVSIADNTLL
jgi:vacuolar-type H+-ATPase subunit I/STV1